MTGADTLVRAVHEAAHAIAALTLGVQVESVSIRDGAGGCVVVYGRDTSPWAVVAMAPTAAGELLGVPTGSHRDEVVAADGQQDADRAYAIAVDLLRPRRFPLLWIATQLLERQELSGADLRDLVTVSG